MKVCPVCGDKCFEDMKVCYGCLHDFSAESAMPQKESGSGLPLERCEERDFGATEDVGFRKSYWQRPYGSLEDGPMMEVPAISVVPDKQLSASVSCAQDDMCAEQAGETIVLRLEVPRNAGVVTVRYANA